MFRKFLPIIAVGIWAIFAHSGEFLPEVTSEVAGCSSRSKPVEPELYEDEDSEVETQVLEQEPAPIPSTPEPAVSESPVEVPCAPIPVPCEAPAPCAPAPVCEKPVPVPAPSCEKPKSCEKSCEKPKSCKKPCPKPCEKPVKKTCKPCVRKPRPVKPACSVQPSCAWNFNPWNPKGCMNTNCGGVYLTGDFLYWRAENQGFGYAFRVQPATVVNHSVGKVVRLDPSWDPGFRVGLGWNADVDFCDILLNYTWYQNRASKVLTNTTGIYRMMPLSNVDSYSQVSAHYRMQLNLGDLEVGRLVYLTKTVALRPHCGVEGGTIYQKFKDHFMGNVAGPNGEFTFYGKNEFWGAGPRLGLNGEWHITKAFSFFGKSASSILYGNTKASSLSKSLAVAGNQFVVDKDYEDCFNQIVPHLQLAVGVQWQTCFWCDQMFFKMGVAAEGNYWWNQFNLPVGTSSFTAPQATVGNQSLNTSGLTCNFEIDF